MKKPISPLILILALCAFCAVISAWSAQLHLNYGQAPNDHTGEGLRSAFAKIETNFNTIFANTLTNDFNSRSNATFLFSGGVGDGDGFSVFYIRPGSQLQVLGDGAVASEILLFGTNAYIRFDEGAAISSSQETRFWKFDGLGVTSNQTARFMDLTNATTSIVATSGLPQLVITGTTNQLIFGATNQPPGNLSAIVKWISVTVAGQTNAYRLPLYQ